MGELHAPQEPTSILQEKVEPDSEEVIEKLAVVAMVGETGWAVIAVSGAVVSAGGVGAVL